jgi:uncharacterized spore protein YtfJ
MDLETLLSRATETLSVGRAFGPPIERDGVLVIPVAWVAGGGGGGEDTRGSEGEGQGGGFGGVTWPLGVYMVKDANVRWVPAIDATRIVLGAIGLVRGLVRLSAARRAGLHS